MPTPYYEPYWLDQDFLEHHGVKGQSWGKRNGPPYPIDRGKDGRVTKTQKKKKQGLIARVKAKYQKKQKAKQRAKAKTAEKKEAISKEEMREKLLKSTDPKFIAKHMDLLQTSEIKERLDRIDTEAKLKKLTVDNSSKKKIDAGMEWVNRIKKIAEATSTAAGAYTAVYNAAQLKEKRQEEKDAAKRKEESERIKDKQKAIENRLAAQQRREQEERREVENRNITENLRRIIDTYTGSSSDLGDIKVDFDPKTGKLSFQTIKKK